METIAYDKQYFSQILNLWNQEMIADPFSEERFLKNIVLDENFSEELCRLYIEDSKVRGFIWAVKRKYPYGERGLEPSRGWIVSLCVDRDFQRKGIGGQLVKDVENILRKDNVKQITLAAYSPNYLFPGVDINNYPNAQQFFENLDYLVGSPAVSMSQDLTKFQFSDFYIDHRRKLQELGYVLSKFKLSDAEDLLQFLKTNFPGGWAKNVKESILENRSEETILILRNRNKEIVGYCQRAIDGNPGRFGPFGVKEDLRGLKLGMYLFNEMMFEMKKHQIYFTYFLWTSGSAQLFYEKNGMNSYREYILMSKKLGE